MALVMLQRNHRSEKKEKKKNNPALTLSGGGKVKPTALPVTVTNTDTGDVFHKH